VFPGEQIDGVQGDGSFRESLQSTKIKQANFAHWVWKKRKGKKK